MEPASLFRMVFFPFCGALLLGLLSLWNRTRADRYAGLIATAVIALSFFPAFHAALGFLSGGEAAPVTLDLGSWMDLAGFDLRARLRLDALSSLLCLIVTGVGMLIHVYSVGYMAHEEGRTRYFAYLNLFCGFMLLLLTGSSLPLIFVGWEGVGLCSYLLIGYWFTDLEKARAGRKAFIVNRIGDAGFLVAMFLCFHVFHSLEIDSIQKWVPALAETNPGVVELIALLLFVGCVGKSAQIPLYIWLPDAMAGPTPVSALIHAATMVTAGVYLLARLSPLYHLAPLASEVVAAVGALTALFAATIALAQKDIKKVLAFSTVSQLGFMVLAMGVGAYWAGIFHLVTHAFFKALLFLAAGSVIHALHGEQNIHKMGGLKNYVMWTTVTFFLGFLAIIGFPLFSGWFSKDAILFGVVASGHPGLFGVALAATVLTAVYMSRLFCLVFLGVPALDRRRLHEIRESGSWMLWPMWILAFFSVIAGALPFKTVLKGFFGGTEALEAGHTWITEGQMTWLVMILVLTAFFLTFRVYQLRPSWLARLGSGRLRAIMERQYRFDEIAMSLVGGLTRVVGMASRVFDEHAIDRVCNWVARKIEGAGSATSDLQTGFLQAYALTILIGSLLLSWYLVSGV